MKPWIKILIGVVAGFAGGFASGFFAHKKMNDIQFEEVSEEEMQEIENTISNTTESLKEKVDKAFSVTDISKEAMNEASSNPEKMKNVLQGKTPYIQADKDQKMAYEKLWKATKNYSDEENANQLPTDSAEGEDADSSEEGFDQEFIEMLEEEGKGDRYVEPPHVISLSEFYNERPEFDKITIDYFEPDKVWLDEKEEIIGDIVSYVGMNDIPSLFEENTPEDDPDVRFIRNEQYGTDYEIIRHHRSYMETTGGM